MVNRLLSVRGHRIKAAFRTLKVDSECRRLIASGYRAPIIFILNLLSQKEMSKIFPP